MSELRRVTPHAVRVDPQLIGRAVAPPWRRALALAVDLALVAIPTVLVATGAAAVAMRASHPAAWRALVRLVREQPPVAEARRLAADIAPVLVAIDAPGLSHELAAAVEQGNRARVEELMANVDLVVNLSFGESAEPAAGKVFVPIDRLVPIYARTLSVLGVPALYFALFHRGRRGATPGKRLLGVAVRRLDGKRMSLLGAFERFGGYFGIPGTFGIGLVELWKHPLRQLEHDRGAGTVVLLARGALAAPPVEPPAAESSTDLSRAASPPGRSRPAHPSAARPPGRSSGRGGGRRGPRRKGR
jgi:hypothetical protein